MPSKNTPLCIKRVAGFTLIEVLVAIVVFSVGLLGVAGLLTSVIGRNQSSVYHSVAVSLANDIAERMRANSGAFSFTSAANKYTSALNSAAPSAAGKNCQASTAICSPEEMAAFDAEKWEALVAKILPQGKGIVCFDASNNANDGVLATDGSISNTGCDGAAGSIAIKLLWNESRSGGSADGTSSTTQRYVMVFQP
ncbi:MAG: pilV [Rhodocyclales bacterium]|nr:pilV [Rhodocyclales bacterium]